MRKLLFFIIVAMMSSCTIYNGVTVDDLYYSGSSVKQVYVDPDRGYLRMRTQSPRWRTFDDDFQYWNFGPGLVGVGSPYGGWNTWRWYSPGFPVYGAHTYPWYGVPYSRPYSIYGTSYPVWYNTGIWNPYNRPTRIQRSSTPEPRRFNLATYGANPNQQSPRVSWTQPSTNQQRQIVPQSTPGVRGGSPTRTFGGSQPISPSRTPVQSQPRPGSAPVRKFN